MSLQEDRRSERKQGTESFLEILPQAARNALEKRDDLAKVIRTDFVLSNGPQLVEVVLDYGRLPVARFDSEDLALSTDEVTFDDLEEAQTKIGVFGNDNRAGIDKTLHRISCLRNKAGRIIGLTCRVGRDIPGSARLIEDIVRKKKSVLLLGRPGIGKTTVIRSICRILADEEKKRVMIVDTSNEIGGDGDIPHDSIGAARRLQVCLDKTQYDTMMEAIENHMPEVIVIDEIGKPVELIQEVCSKHLCLGFIKECEAAETISKRSVQLIATAHGEYFCSSLVYLA